MSKHKPPKKKKVVVTTKKTVETGKGKITPTVSRSKASSAPEKQTELILGKQNYIWIGIGAALIFVGMLLMVGGAMPSPDVWEPDLIYSFRRTVLAPIVILAGFVVEIYAIFKK